MTPKYILTITHNHVATPRSLGVHHHGVMDCLGALLPLDIGKRVYETAPGIYQVENVEQLRARLRKEHEVSK